MRGATSYELYRSSSVSGPYNLVPTTANTSTVDSGRAADTTYLYKVRAIGASGPSDYSGIEPATTVVFLDTVLAGVPVKAIHVTQLRTAVNAMRTAAELTAVTFAEPALGGAIVKRVHLTDLRTALDEARNALGIPAITYTGPVITPGVTTIKAAHWLEVRAGTQ